jgi:hypothetical protein
MSKPFKPCFDADVFELDTFSFILLYKSLLISWHAICPTAIVEEEMKTKQNILNFPKDKLTYCVNCSSTILWHRSGQITLIGTATIEVLECMKHGCVLINHMLPEKYSGPDEIGSFLLTLIHDGIPSNIAEAAALTLVNVSPAA